ncbi:MAG: hypothetical protein IMW89_07660 [Ktedonobacteraceae bacterium]|nr:hypothetical protein [Ktedonobacteraceae bacterium]
MARKSFQDTPTDPRISIFDYNLVQQLDDAILVGRWFVFYKPSWLERSGLAQTLTSGGIEEVKAKQIINFRGKKSLRPPGANIDPTPFLRPQLASLTCDKALYRADRDTVRLLIAMPQHAGITCKLRLLLNSNPYADYSVTLDEYGLALWSMQGLPEGEYEARLVWQEQLSSETTTQRESDVCRFEVAEYRLAPLNAELVAQTLNGNRLSYTLAVTAFGQPYSGQIEVELQERGRRIGKRQRLSGDDEGRYSGTVELSGAGPYTLNVFAGERTATVALKGSERERRETLTISELGEVQALSLLPLPGAEECRGMYVSTGGSNNAPFLVRRVIGGEVEITPRAGIEQLRIVIVDPARDSHSETLYEQLVSGQALRLPVPSPYGILLLGAFIDGEAWEGWCAVLHPSELQVTCEAPQQARPGSSVTVTVKTNVPDRVVPVQLIVKDQRLIAPSDPQVELAAAMKKNLGEWREQSATGTVKHRLVDYTQHLYRAYRQSGGFAGMVITAAPLPPMAFPAPLAPGQPVFASAQEFAPMAAPGSTLNYGAVMEQERGAPVATAPAATATLTRVRMQFPEIIYNNIVRVQGEAHIEVKLGDSMTRYSIEAFALDSASLDWRRAETSLEAVQPVYGELTVSPFAMPGDPVMGRLDIGAASGQAYVEVRLDDAPLPLFDEKGAPLATGQPVASGTVVRFPVRPGALTAIVRDAESGESDVSERYITEPGKLRHIMRRLRLLIPGDEVTLEQEHLLEIRPLPGLERPFQFFIEGAAKYPFG